MAELDIHLVYGGRILCFHDKGFFIPGDPLLVFPFPFFGNEHASVTRTECEQKSECYECGADQAK